MKRREALLRKNRAFVREVMGGIGRQAFIVLADLTREYGFSVPLGDSLLLDGKWYVTNTGLIHLANRSKCYGIRVAPICDYCEPTLGRWVFEARVYKFRGSTGFMGYGDADPSNVSQLVRGAEMRVAETRAVNRALRKAYGIGLCSLEELGWVPRRPDPESQPF